jgi:hypothetical protein
MARKGITETLLEQGTRILSKAAATVMSDPRGQDAVARAVGLAQRGKRRIEEAQERFMKAAGIPGRREYQDLARQLARIKRKARELSERLDHEDAVRDGPGATPPAENEPRGADDSGEGGGAERGER